MTSASTLAQVRDIAREAWLYGYPVIEMYRTLHAQAIDRAGPNFKAPFNRIGHTARVFTPHDSAFITPNADTPYSFLWMDLRAEPLVLQLPAIEPDRYGSVQLIDLYTHNVAYLGTRTDGNGGATVLIGGPAWNGAAPPGVGRSVRFESNIAYALMRTQMFDDADLARVRDIQAGYAVCTLSEFMGASAPPAAPPIDWPAPVDASRQALASFGILNFMLQFAVPDPADRPLLQRLATIGIGPALPFDEGRLESEVAAAMRAGIQDAQADYARFAQHRLATRQVTSADLFGTRGHLRNNTLFRYAGAVLGIFGNSAEEAVYFASFADAQGRALNGAAHRYGLRLPPGGLPPADAFWSVTMYDGRSKLLVDNPIGRYLINSRMLYTLLRDDDGGITLDIQHAATTAARQPNWLPAPAGPFYCVFRLYLPQPAVVKGQWRQPPLEAVGPAEEPGA